MARLVILSGANQKPRSSRSIRGPPLQAQTKIVEIVEIVEIVRRSRCDAHAPCRNLAGPTAPLARHVRGSAADFGVLALTWASVARAGAVTQNSHVSGRETCAFAMEVLVGNVARIPGLLRAFRLFDLGPRVELLLQADGDCHVGGERMFLVCRGF